MVNCWKKEAYIQGKRGNLTFARPVLQGLRIAHSPRTSNAESPRRYVQQTIRPFGKGHIGVCMDTPHEDVFVAVSHFEESKVAKF